MSLLQASLFLPAAVAQEKRPLENLVIAYPGKSWALQIDAPGFVVKSKERKLDGREYLTAENSGTGIFLSVMMEKGTAVGSFPSHRSIIAGCR
jgi:hypothetical protein